MRGTLNSDDTANFQNAVTAGSFVKSGGTSDQYLMADGSVSSGGGLIEVRTLLLLMHRRAAVVL